ncbi:hypothetical protein [Streptomyces sp. NPDC086182]|jgi:hypothetical protein|uniref:hypothetical protein n=1 Tax=Streptomyces sp. NPDC086182 TaxID=3155058 RepID=UPI003446B5E7
MTVRELPWARFGGATRWVRRVIVTLFRMIAVLLPHDLPAPTVGTMPTALPHDVSGSVSRPALPLSTAHIRRAPWLPASFDAAQPCVDRP